jgi:hypothetical protein
VDLDLSPTRRRSLRLTRRKAKNKAKIWPTLFASCENWKGIMLDLSH